VGDEATAVSGFGVLLCGGLLPLPQLAITITGISNRDFNLSSIIILCV
jgi:hypothetical protein